MKKLSVILALIMFVQISWSQHDSSRSSPSGSLIKAPDVNLNDYLAQLKTGYHFQGEAPVVPPQEGKTETENVWVSRGLWIALIAIIIIIYLKRRKKPEQ